MPPTAQTTLDQTAESSPNEQVLLKLLESIERDGGQSQRGYADDVGVALGLVNAYLKRCVRKGLIKVQRVPAKRYSYYLTPQGFAEKSRLTFHYLSLSLSFFRRAQKDCDDVLDLALSRGWKRIAMVGASDLAEIALICAVRRPVQIVGIVDQATPDWRFESPSISEQQALAEAIDGVLITTRDNPQAIAQTWAGKLGADRVLAPALVGLDMARIEQAERSLNLQEEQS